MYQYVFRNRWVAIAFAIMTLVSAVAMVGTSERGGTLDQTLDLLQAEREGKEKPSFAGISPEGPGEGDDLPARSRASEPVFGDYVASEQAAR